MRIAGVVGAAALALLLLEAQLAAQGNQLIGKWATTLYPGTAGRLYLTLDFAPDGGLGERMMNRQGLAVDLVGTYRFDAAPGVLRYTWRDYMPKQTCTPFGSCQRLPAPPVRLGVEETSQITFQNPNFMVGRAADGTVLAWVRIN